MMSKLSRDPSLLACSNKILRFGRKAPTEVVNQRKNIFFIRFHTIGYRFKLLQPIALLFSIGTLKPLVYTLTYCCLQCMKKGFPTIVLTSKIQHMNRINCIDFHRCVSIHVSVLSCIDYLSLSIYQPTLTLQTAIYTIT